MLLAKRKMATPDTNLIQDKEISPLVTPEGDEKKRKYISVLRAEKYWIDRARINPEFFIHYVSGKEPARHHRIWLKDIFDFTDAGRANGTFRLNIIAPRESGKSSILVYSMLWFASRFPWLTNMIVSVSAKQAEDRLEMVRDILQHDIRYRNVFPWINVDYTQRNTVNEFTLKSDAIYSSEEDKVSPINYNVWRSLIARVGSLKDPTLYACGNGSKGVVGRRISGILLMDDIIDESHLRDTLQEEVEDYIKRTLVNCVQPNAKMVNIGTRWTPNDVPNRLKNNPGWKTIEIQALRYFPNGTAASYWPEYWPVERLLEKRMEIDNDALFNLMYMNDPTAMSSAKFTLSGLSQPLPSPLPHFTGVYVGTDFAISTSQRADFTVFTAIGIDEMRRLYLLDIKRMKATPDIVLKELNEFVNRTAANYGTVTKVFFEKVAFQTVMKFNIAEKYPHIPTAAVPPVGDKGARADLFARKCNDMEVFFNTNAEAYRVLVSEALNFGVAGHDDCVDSCSIVVVGTSAVISNAVFKVIRSPYLK